MDSMNQELKGSKKKRAQQDKIVKLLMMQGVRLTTSKKKLAKVNMSSTFSRLGKARKMNRICVGNGQLL